MGNQTVIDLRSRSELKKSRSQNALKARPKMVKQKPGTKSASGSGSGSGSELDRDLVQGRREARTRAGSRVNGEKT
jgi:hypothetical protein